jgi:DNA processing protein
MDSQINQQSMNLTTNNIIKLLQVKGMGRRTAFKICNQIDFQMDEHDLIDYLFDFSNLYPNVRMPVLDRKQIAEGFVKAENIIEKSELNGVKIISYFESSFPTSLRSIPDPPLLVNIKGNIDALDKKVGIAIIGTREPTEAGVKAAIHFSSLLADMGYNIVSGLAKGCDTAAHKGSLLAKGTTTALLAHGLQTVYPKENRNLADQILDNGGVLFSEYLYGTGALTNYFVERDRLQAGLSKATIVIQTGEKGGTMHAVRATINSKKSLAAVKYNTKIEISDKILGNELLFRQGEAFQLSSGNLLEFVKTFSSPVSESLALKPALEEHEVKRIASFHRSQKSKSTESQSKPALQTKLMI